MGTSPAEYGGVAVRTSSARPWPRPLRGTRRRSWIGASRSGYAVESELKGSPDAAASRADFRCEVRILSHARAETATAFGIEEDSAPLFEQAELCAARFGAEIRNAPLTFQRDHEEDTQRPEIVWWKSCRGEQSLVRC